MIVRIVKMQVNESNKVLFKQTLKDYQPLLKKQKGCMQIDMLNDKKIKDIYYSYTIWDNEENLKKYKNSDFYKELSSKVLPLCEKEPQAWTVDEAFEKP
ncbi:MAG: hypothetical protein A2046_04560 [Bacteroidetes bacterium GWA2_30_7]|nr:MAG: hypothetical protein A2046_04560 [Bacteroidetes bacterium GWA2_30_7]